MPRHAVSVASTSVDVLHSSHSRRETRTSLFRQIAYTTIKHECMSYKSSTQCISASIRCVNLVSSFYRCHHRFLKWEVFLPYSLITTSTFTDGVFHCSHRVGIRQLSYCPNRLILFRITFITVGLFRWTSNPAQTTLDKFLMLIRNRPNHFHTPIRATGVKDLNCIQGFVQRV